MSHLPVGPVHHLRMTVTDVERSKAFYTEVLGFEVAVDGPPPPEDASHDEIVESLQGVVSSCTGDVLRTSSPTRIVPPSAIASIRCDRPSITQLRCASACRLDSHRIARERTRSLLADRT